MLTRASDVRLKRDVISYKESAKNECDGYQVGLTTGAMGDRSGQRRNAVIVERRKRKRASSFQVLVQNW